MGYNVIINLLITLNYANNQESKQQLIGINMTKKEAKQLCKEVGFGFKYSSEYNEYTIYPLNNPKHTYYTDCINDAVSTAKNWR
mgnify:CR=1 FL=1